MNYYYIAGDTTEYHIYFKGYKKNKIDNSIIEEEYFDKVIYLDVNDTGVNKEYYGSCIYKGLMNEYCIVQYPTTLYPTLVIDDYPLLLTWDKTSQNISYNIIVGTNPVLSDNYLFQFPNNPTDKAVARELKGGFNVSYQGEEYLANNIKLYLLPNDGKDYTINHQNGIYYAFEDNIDGLQTESLIHYAWKDNNGITQYGSKLIEHGYNRNLSFWREIPVKLQVDGKSIEFYINQKPRQDEIATIEYFVYCPLSSITVNAYDTTCTFIYSGQKKITYISGEIENTYETGLEFTPTFEENTTDEEKKYYFSIRYVDSEPFQVEVIQKPYEPLYLKVKIEGDWLTYNTDTVAHYNYDIIENGNVVSSGTYNHIIEPSHYGNVMENYLDYGFDVIYKGIELNSGRISNYQLPYDNSQITIKSKYSNDNTKYIKYALNEKISGEQEFTRVHFAYYTNQTHYYNFDWEHGANESEDPRTITTSVTVNGVEVEITETQQGYKPRYIFKPSSVDVTVPAEQTFYSFNYEIWKYNATIEDYEKYSESIKELTFEENTTAQERIAAEGEIQYERWYLPYVIRQEASDTPIPPSPITGYSYDIVCTETTQYVDWSATTATFEYTGITITHYADGSETRSEEPRTQTFNFEENRSDTEKTSTFELVYHNAKKTVKVVQDIFIQIITENYFRFDATTNDVYIGFDGVYPFYELQYSLGGRKFKSFTESVLVPQGTTIYFRGKGSPSTAGSRKFTTSAPCECHGDVRSLLSYEDFEHVELTPYCFSYLLYYTQITTAPSEIATTLADWCYNYMFQGCTSLTTVPSVLPANTLTQYCYRGMFYDCTSLTTAPKLPATNLAKSCYEGMFDGCTSLTTVPSVLPATTLAWSCYNKMFRGCTSLTTAPELPATTLAYSCYYGMFEKCTSLTTAPELVLASYGFGLDMYDMFKGCSSLNYINIETDHWYSSSTVDWVKDVAPTGTFVKPITLVDIPINNDSGVPIGWTIINKGEIIIPNYLSFVATTNDVNIGFTNFNRLNSPQYSFDGLTWLTFKTTIKLTQGETVYFRGDGMNNVADEAGGTFTTSAPCECHGDVRSLLNYEYFESVSLQDFCFRELFQNTKITTAPELLSTNLKNYCYLNMFESCTNLTTAPELPATTLAPYCYRGMFARCTSLTTAPELQAMILADSCYLDMFNGCTSLTTAPELPATTLFSDCYGSMFQGCTSLTTVPSVLPATNLATRCYSTMFMYCTSLTTAPELIATNLVNNCYPYMFFGCTKLNYIKVRATSWSNLIADMWVYNVSSTGTFVKPSNTSISSGFSGIPNGWTVQNI